MPQFDSVVHLGEVVAACVFFLKVWGQQKEQIRRLAAIETRLETMYTWFTRAVLERTNGGNK